MERDIVDYGSHKPDFFLYKFVAHHSDECCGDRDRVCINFIISDINLVHCELLQIDRSLAFQTGPRTDLHNESTAYSAPSRALNQRTSEICPFCCNITSNSQFAMNNFRIIPILHSINYQC